jgi:hypothetical protein
LKGKDALVSGAVRSLNGPGTASLIVADMTMPEEIQRASSTRR